MADWTQAPPGAESLTATRVGAASWASPGPDEADDDAPVSARQELAGWNAAEVTKLARARIALRLLGGATSLALVAGLAVWGHKLMLREVLGLPVIAAAEGPMRVVPADPEGEVPADLGLAVNAVPAAGGAAAPSDVLHLAPQAPGLAPEDMEVAQTAAEAAEPYLAAAEPAATPAVASPLDVTGVVATAAAFALPEGRAMTPEEILAFADALAAGAAPLAPLPEAAAVPAVAVIPATVPGVAVALRPPARPGTVAAAAAPAPAPEAAPEATPAAAPVAVTAALDPGTPLVQLGAFDSAEVAASEWERLTADYPEFLEGRERVIQEAVSGGQTFFRLRAVGFADLADARRLCAVMDAEGQGCITHVVP